MNIVVVYIIDSGKQSLMQQNFKHTVIWSTAHSRPTHILCQSLLYNTQIRASCKQRVQLRQWRNHGKQFPRFRY